MLKVVFRDEWEELYKDNKLILCGHKLDVTDVLSALGYDFETEEIKEEE